MQLRARKNKKTTEFDPDRMQLTDELHLNGVMEKEGQLEKLQHCIGTLSTDQKQVVDLFYLKDKCYKEIETITGMDWNKVRSLIQNGRRNLKICMEKNTVAPGLSRLETINTKSGT